LLVLSFVGLETFFVVMVETFGPTTCTVLIGDCPGPITFNAGQLKAFHLSGWETQWAFWNIWVIKFVQSVYDLRCTDSQREQRKKEKSHNAGPES
jgi:hypothetical protein